MTTRTRQNLTVAVPLLLQRNFMDTDIAKQLYLEVSLKKKNGRIYMMKYINFTFLTFLQITSQAAENVAARRNL